MKLLASKHSTCLQNSVPKTEGTGKSELHMSIQPSMVGELILLLEELV